MPRPYLASWIVVVFANGGVIMGSLMLILGADILIAGLLAKKMERAPSLTLPRSMKRYRTGEETGRSSPCVTAVGAA
jgi:hypothetical protein